MTNAQHTGPIGRYGINGKIKPVEDLSYGQIGRFHCSLDLVGSLSFYLTMDSVSYTVKCNTHPIVHKRMSHIIHPLENGGVVLHSSKDGVSV